MEIPVDKYTYQARLMPTLVAFAPLGFAFGVWSVQETALWKLFIALFASLGFATILAQLGRDLGKRKELSLFNQWGGKPTTRLLSHRFSRLDQLTLKRYHAKLRATIPDLKIPEQKDEMQNPTDALKIYESCALFLRERTRDRKNFPLVFSENVNYGFRRNLWAWKPFGISFALIGLTSCVLFLVFRWHGVRFELLFAAGTGALSAALLLLWVFVFKPSWVCIAAEAYADRLIGSLDSL
jgi:hypothetical protein